MTLKEQLQDVVTLTDAAKRCRVSRGLVKIGAEGGAFETRQVGSTTLCRLSEVRGWLRNHRRRSKAEVIEAVQAADLSAFPSRTKRILDLRYNQGVTREDVAKRERLSIQRVDQIARGALDSLFA